MSFDLERFFFDVVWLGSMKIEGVVGVVDAASVSDDEEPDEPDFLEARDFFDDDDEETSDGEGVVVDESPVVLDVLEESVEAESELVDEEPDERDFFEVRDFFVEDDDEAFVDESPVGVGVVLEESVEPVDAPLSVGAELPALVGSDSVVLVVAGGDEPGVVEGGVESVGVLDDAPVSVLEGVAVLGAGVPILVKKSLRKSLDLAGAAAPSEDASADPDVVPVVAGVGVVPVEGVELLVELLPEVVVLPVEELVPAAVKPLSDFELPAAVQDCTSFFNFEDSSTGLALSVLLSALASAFFPLLSASSANAA